MLRIEGLKKQFGAVRAVDGVDAELPSGQLIGVIGRSGAGKSTLLRLVNRLIEPDAGTIRFEDLVVSDLRGHALRHWRASCAMIFQQFNLVGRLDVLTNVLIGRLSYRATVPSLFKAFSARERALAIRALERVDLVPQALQRAEWLSGGQQQRAAIARALVQEPRIVLADEPIASLDPRNAAMVMDCLRGIVDRDGITVLCNLHTLETAKVYCDRVLGMAEGRIVFDGSPDGLTERVIRGIYGMDEEATLLVPRADARAEAAQPSITPLESLAV